MNFRGGIRLPEDGIEREIHARLTINLAADEIIVAAEDDYVLGEWQLAEVVVEPQGDLDFLLKRSKDELVFRPDSPAAYTAFANATAPPSNSVSVSAQIPRTASSPPEPERTSRRSAAHASVGRKAGRWRKNLGTRGRHRK
jgi:hypothetical protein